MNHFAFYISVGLLGLLFCSLVLAAGVSFPRSQLSQFELARRRKSGEGKLRDAPILASLTPDLLILQKVSCYILLVLFVGMSFIVLGGLNALLLSIVVAVGHKVLARTPLVTKSSAGILVKYEPKLVSFTEKHARSIQFFRSPEDQHNRSLDSHVSSREELIHVINTTNSHTLDLDQKTSLIAGLHFAGKRVADIMTLRGSISSIAQSELLGPLVLDDLHKTGHSRFVVTDGDLDHIVGILSITDLLTLDAGKGSTTVKKAMQPRVFYILQDQSLEQALAAFSAAHSDLLIVTNDREETVGLVSLNDVLLVLRGRKVPHDSSVQ